MTYAEMVMMAKARIRQEWWYYAAIRHDLANMMSSTRIYPEVFHPMLAGKVERRRELPSSPVGKITGLSLAEAVELMDRKEGR